MELSACGKGTRHDRPPTIVLVNLPWKPNRSMINSGEVALSREVALG